MTLLKSSSIYCISIFILATLCCVNLQAIDSEPDFEAVHQDIGRITSSSSPSVAGASVVRQLPSQHHHHQHQHQHQQQQQYSPAVERQQFRQPNNNQDQNSSPRRKLTGARRVTFAVKPHNDEPNLTTDDQVVGSTPQLARPRHLSAPPPALEPSLLVTRSPEPRPFAETRESSLQSSNAQLINNQQPQPQPQLQHQPVESFDAPAASFIAANQLAQPTQQGIVAAPVPPPVDSIAETQPQHAFQFQAQPQLQQFQAQAQQQAPVFESRPAQLEPLIATAPVAASQQHQQQQAFHATQEEQVPEPSFDSVVARGCPPLGVFSWPNSGLCDRYYMCTNGTFTEEACPNGLAYSKLGAVYMHCAYAHNVDCGNKKTPQPVASIGCPWQFGIFPAHNSQCSINYHVCEWGAPEVKQCKDGLFYDEKIKGCQWADQLGCKSEPILQFKCPLADEDNQYYPFPRYYHSSSDVIVCVNDTPRLVHCNEDQFVDRQSLACLDKYPKKRKQIGAAAATAHNILVAQQNQQHLSNNNNHHHVNRQVAVVHRQAS